MQDRAKRDVRPESDLTYIFASPGETAVPSSATVFYRIESNGLAQNLCALFAKEYAGDKGGTNFHCAPASSISAQDQVLLDEAIQGLEVYDDPDPGVYDPPPTKDMITRAQYAIRARTWEELLRHKVAESLPRNRPTPGDDVGNSPTFAGEVPEMSAEDLRNAGLTLLMSLAQAYYKLLESAVGGYCAALDLDLNHAYLWTLKSIRELLANHPDLADFPISFEPVFPDLYPTTILDCDWEDMVAPGAERFLSTVQEYVMNKGGIYPPEEQSPAWIFIEMFKPSINSAIEAGIAYQRRMQQYFKKTLERASDMAAKRDASNVPSPPTGHGSQGSQNAATLEAIHTVAKGIKQNTDMIPDLIQMQEAIPSRTAAMLRGTIKQRLGTLGTVAEEDFTASPHFTNLSWRKNQYVLRGSAAIIIETLYIAQKHYGIPGMHQDEIFAQVYGSNKNEWPSNNTRIQNFFRTGDAKRLWDDGLMGHDGKGNFHLNLKIHTSTQ